MGIHQEHLIDENNMDIWYMTCSVGDLTGKKNDCFFVKGPREWENPHKMIYISGYLGARLHADG